MAGIGQIIKGYWRDVEVRDLEFKQGRIHAEHEFSDTKCEPSVLGAL